MTGPTPPLPPGTHVRVHSRFGARLGTVLATVPLASDGIRRVVVAFATGAGRTVETWPARTLEKLL